MTEELKPCPFCNGVCIARAGHHMTCVRCGAEGPDADNPTDDEAITAWNTRAAPPVSTGVVRDAERYRWLKENGEVNFREHQWFHTSSGHRIHSTCPTIPELDAAIDAAISAAPTYGGDQGGPAPD